MASHIRYLISVINLLWSGEIFLIILLQLVSGSCSAMLRDASSLYLKTDGPVMISASSSSDFINETNVINEFQCQSRCLIRNCALVTFIKLIGICQLLMLNDENVALGPSSSHVNRVVGSDAGAIVWKVKDFDDLIKSRMLNDMSTKVKISVNFSNTASGRNGSIQQTMVNVTGCYRIDVAGARGGNSPVNSKLGGKGALASGNFSLHNGTQLTIVVGQMGGQGVLDRAGGGGGGGSFVYKRADSLLMAAGGGGGCSSICDGLAGQSTRNGSDSFCGSDLYRGIGGVNGQPGYNKPNDTASSSKHGGCGAGWLGRAVNQRKSVNDGERGGSLADGWVGGKAGSDSTNEGGFGGGGGGGGDGLIPGAGGAGGGFSGGGAGVGSSQSGGGGGSYCAGSGCIATTGGNLYGDHGHVSLRLLVPFADTCD